MNDSIILCYQIRTVDKQRLTKLIGFLEKVEYRIKILDSLSFQLSIGDYTSIEWENFKKDSKIIEETGLIQTTVMDNWFMAEELQPLRSMVEPLGFTTFLECLNSFEKAVAEDKIIRDKLESNYTTYVRNINNLLRTKEFWEINGISLIDRDWI